MLKEMGSSDMKLQTATCLTLQEAAEMYLVQVFEDASLCTIHAQIVKILS